MRDRADLLLIDTKETYEQLRRELARHADSVGRYLVIARTALYGTHGEDERSDGLGGAVEEFLRGGAFVLDRKIDEGAGLTALRRA